eukprot:scaffold42764_cov50-Phaeocystis_antarctica.AAC.4
MSSAVHTMAVSEARSVAGACTSSLKSRPSGVPSTAARSVGLGGMCVGSGRTAVGCHAPGSKRAASSSACILGWASAPMRCGSAKKVRRGEVREHQLGVSRGQRRLLVGTPLPARAAGPGLGGGGRVVLEQLQQAGGGEREDLVLRDVLGLVVPEEESGVGAGGRRARLVPAALGRREEALEEVGRALDHTQHAMEATHLELARRALSARLGQRLGGGREEELQVEEEVTQAGKLGAAREQLVRLAGEAARQLLPLAPVAERHAELVGQRQLARAELGASRLPPEEPSVLGRDAGDGGEVLEELAAHHYELGRDELERVGLRGKVRRGIKAEAEG